MPTSKEEQQGKKAGSDTNPSDKSHDDRLVLQLMSHLCFYSRAHDTCTQQEFVRNIGKILYKKKTQTVLRAAGIEPKKPKSQPNLATHNDTPGYTFKQQLQGSSTTTRR